MKTLQQFVQNLSCAQCQCGMRESEVEKQIQERIDQEKAALKDKIKHELLTEWTWSDVALMSDVLKKIERM